MSGGGFLADGGAQQAKMVGPDARALSAKSMGLLRHELNVDVYQRCTPGEVAMLAPPDLAARQHIANTM